MAGGGTTPSAGIRLATRRAPSRSSVRRSLAGAAVVAVGAAAAAAWATASLGGRAGAVAVVALVALAGVALVALVAHTWAYGRPERRTRLVALAVTTACGLALVVLVWNGSIAALRLQAARRSWTATADALVASTPPNGPCSPRGTRSFPRAARADLPGFGRIGSVCVDRDARDDPLVLLASAGSRPEMGLAYVPGGNGSLPQDTCVDHVGGPWWQYADLGGQSTCPLGFHFIGGG